MGAEQLLFVAGLFLLCALIGLVVSTWLALRKAWARRKFWRRW